MRALEAQMRPVAAELSGYYFKGAERTSSGGGADQRAREAAQTS